MQGIQFQIQTQIIEYLLDNSVISNIYKNKNADKYSRTHRHSAISLTH